MSDTEAASTGVSAAVEQIQEEVAALVAAKAAPVSAAAIDKWVVDKLYNSPASQSSAVINHITQVAVPELKRRLGAV